MRDYEPLLVITAILTALTAIGYAVYGIGLGVWKLACWLLG